MPALSIGKLLSSFAFAAAIALPAVAASTDEIKGTIESIDPQTQSFTVSGQSITVNDGTSYDDGYQSFGDLKVGDRVEVDYRNDNGRLLATEVERDD